MTDIKSIKIPYRDTNSFSKTVLAYLDKDPKLKGFIEEWPDLDAFEKLIKRKTGFANRQILVETLKDQYQKIQDYPNQVRPAVHNHLDSLELPNTYTVTTGHQLNIFTGPLYFLFKIASTIRLARDLKKKYPDSNFVPVYWMATEDHDFEEINHTFVLNTKISWDKTVGSAAGRVSTQDIHATLKQYQNILGLGGFAGDLTALVEKAYVGHTNLADATRSFVNSLFGEEGLVIIDGDDVRLKRIFSPVMVQDILDQNSFQEVQKTNEKLIENGFNTQVFAREINFFYLQDAFRERIIPLQDGSFEINNQELHFTKEELLQEISTHPERFSPNVIMRPVYQEFILPNLAYIGGGAEIVYWLQLKAVFDFYKIQFPLLIPRNSALFISSKQLNQWRHLGFEIRDIFDKRDVLKKKFVLATTTHQLDLKDEKDELDGVFDQLKNRVSSIDPTLRASAEAVQTRLGHALLRLEKKLLKAEKRNHADAIAKIDQVKDTLFPDGTLQERHENFAVFYIKHGQDLVNVLIRELNPLDFNFTILDL